MNAVVSNVIAFAPASGRGTGTDASQHGSLVREIRRRTVDKLGQAAAHAFDKVADELYELAEQSLDRDTRDYYLAQKEAWPGLRTKLEARFRERLDEVFQRNVDGEQERAQEFSDMQGSWTELSLVADGELEETVRFTEIAGRIRNAADEELAALDQRMAVILSRPGMEAHDNPLSPMAICDAFRSSLSVVESGMKMKLLLIRFFDQGARGEVVALYKDVNALLKDNGILPTIRYGAAKKPVSGTGPVTGPSGGGGSGAGAVVGSVTLPLVAGAPGAAGGVALQVGGLAAGGVGGVAMPGVAGMPGIAGGTPGAVAGMPGGMPGAMGAGAAGLADGGDPFAMLQQLVLTMAARQAMPGGGGALGAAGFAAGAPGAAGLAAGVPGLEVSQAAGLAGLGGAAAGHGHGGGAGPAGFPGAGGARGFAGGGFLGSLTRIQQGDFSGVGADVTAAFAASGVSGYAGGGVDGGGLAGGGLAGAGGTSGGDVGGSIGSGDFATPANVLHKLKGTSLASQMGQMDTVTLDIVALLFDQIFGDPRIPAPMKALIGRLQIPMLKVAVLDKAFFSKKNHPARRMLDTLGELSLGLGEGFDASSTLYKRLEAILQKVVDEFEDDLDLFDRITAELEMLLADADKTAEQAAKKEARRIQDRERLEVARLFAQNELRGRVANQAVPRAVLRFLATEWMKLMILAYAKGGRESRAWQSLVETMDILVWTLTPKHTVEERRRLVALLPALLKRLHKGMEVIGTAAPVKERFNAVLMRCHARAIAGSNMGSSDGEVPLAAERRMADRVIAAASARRAAQDVAGKAGAAQAGAARAEAAPDGATRTPPPMLKPIPEAKPDSALPVKTDAASIPTLLPEPGPAAPVMALEPATPLAHSAASMMVEEVPMPDPADAAAVLAAPDAAAPAADPVTEAAVLQEELVEMAVPDTLPTITVKNPFGDGDIQVEEVSFSDLPGIAPAAARTHASAGGDRYTEMVANLKEGDWIEIRDDDDAQPKQARLSYVSPYRSTYVFANRKGQEIGEFSLYQLTRDLRCGRIVMLDSVPLFERAFGGLVGMLRKGAEETA